MINGSDMFAAWASERYSIPEWPELPQESRCKLCGLSRRPLLDLAPFFKAKINFTDVDIWRFDEGQGVCSACSLVLTQGLKGSPYAWSFLAWGDPKASSFQALFPWNPYDHPWYRIPRERPLLVVVPGHKYKQKHTIFRGEAVYNANALFG